MWQFFFVTTFCIIWAIMASEGFSSESFSSKSFSSEELGKAKPGACNTSITAKNNSGFHSGAFNESSGVYCWWNITSFDNKPITLFFFYLFLHEHDNVTIYRDVNGNRTALAPVVKANNGSLAVITDDSHIYMELRGNDISFIRRFEGFFSNDGSVAVPPDVKVIHSPIYAEDVTDSKDVIYRFDDVQHVQALQVFNFEKLNLSPGSKLNIEGSSYSGDFKPSIDFFNTADDHKPLMITVNMKINSTDYFKLNAHEVDKRCSYFKKLESDLAPEPLISPKFMINNGSIINECRWIFQHTGSKKLGLKFDTLDFKSVFDIVAVNDGIGEFSMPLLQVTTSNRNVSQTQIIRSSGSQLWISFKPIDYTSSFKANVTIHGQGGYYRNNGTITMDHTVGNDTVFLLEVEKGKNVMLKFSDSSVSPPATLYVYDGFDQSNLLTTLHGQINFPILSRSSKMMIIAVEFSLSHFTAKFEGITPGCNQMSAENYILTENCNSSCTWVIPPQDSPNSMLLLNLQYVSLNEKDVLKIHQLDSNLTELGTVTTNQSHVPQIAVSANVGLLVDVVQADCKVKKDKIILIGHSSYMPDCNHDIILKSSEKYQISSPLYPDTYPLFATCQWKISVEANNLIHMNFENLKLAENHCVEISHNSSSKKYEYNGKILPKDDLFLTGDASIEFRSTNCSKSRVGQLLSSDEGFLLNITVTDCGKVLDDTKDGEFITTISGKNTSICMWKVSIPPTEGDSVNVISYTVNKTDKLQNYELKVYDGSSVRDPGIDNNTESNIWSRTNSLIFVYTRLNVSQSSSVLVVKYHTISCNTSMQCQNKMCLHPDWRCNGIDECGDNTDERNCASVPVPPEIKFTGYSGTAFWLCSFAMLAIGIIFGVLGPICYQKWKDSRYTRFRELSGIDG